MTGKFYQVLAAIGDRKTEMLFSDLTAKELDQEFVAPCRRAKAAPIGVTTPAGRWNVRPTALKRL